MDTAAALAGGVGRNPIFTEPDLSSECDVATQEEAEVQPDGIADHLSRKAVAGVTSDADRFHLSRIA